MSMKITDTNYGRLEGVEKEGYTLFAGVPYAKPPVGDLRWKPPQPPEKWEGIRKAHKFQNRCMQFNFNKNDFYYKEFYANPDFVPEMSEDSLYLNIWTPAENSGEKLPVAFWIHGGAFMHGFGSELEFDGAEYAKRGVILVSINYRVGALGFMSHKWLEDENGLSGNYGILDQIAALKWVQENIEAFGGDRERVTIFGQSAGSMSVQTLCSSPLAGGLFSGAIMQSGGGYNGGYSRDMTVDSAHEIAEAFIAATGAKNVDELRTLSGQEIVDFTAKMMSEADEPGLRFVPIIDGSLLQYGYDKTLEMGLHHDVNYMLGCTSEDLNMGGDTTGRENPLYKACQNFALNNERLGKKPTYVYYFSHKPKGDNAGAFHSSELWYTFGTLGRSWRPKDETDYELSAKMLDCWTDFMKSGSIRNEQPYTKSNPYIIEFK